MCTLWRLAFLAFHKIWFGFSLLWPVDRTDRASFVHRARTPPEPPKWWLTNIPTMPLSFFPFFLMVSTEHYCLIMSEAPFPERVRSVWVIENLFLITESFQHMNCASQWHPMHYFTQLNAFVLFELYPGCTLFKGWSHLWLVMNRRSIGDQMSLEEGPLMRRRPLRFCPVQIRRF